MFRTPEEMAAADARLRKRFTGELGTYHDAEMDLDIEFRIEKGDLWAVPSDGQASMRIAVEEEEDGVFPVVGPPLRIRFEPRVDGKAPGLTLFIGPGPDAQQLRLPRVDK